MRKFRGPSILKQNPINELVLQERKKSSNLRTEALLSAGAGAVTLYSALTSRPLVLSVLRGTSPEILQPVAILVTLFLGIGGVFFISGALILLFRRRSFGRPLVAIAGGLGVFTLLFCLAATFVDSSFSIQALLSIGRLQYLTGIILASSSVFIEIETMP